jgi:hypothetical protein
MKNDLHCIAMSAIVRALEWLFRRHAILVFATNDSLAPSKHLLDALHHEATLVSHASALHMTAVLI